MRAKRMNLLDINSRVGKIGQTLEWLKDVIRKEYSLNTSHLGDYVNGVRSGPKGDKLLNAADEILKRYERKES